MIRIPTRLILVFLLAVGCLVGGVSAFVATSHTPASHPNAEPAVAAEDDAEDDGGPAAPADYLTAKYTSFADVSLAQVRRAQAQARALPSTAQQWSLVGPTNIGG